MKVGQATLLARELGLLELERLGRSARSVAISSWTRSRTHWVLTALVAAAAG
jgi:hypothetical protein